MFVYLKKFNYQGWVTSDMSPMRVDPVVAFERTIATTEKYVKMANRLDSRKLFDLMKREKTLEILEWMEEQVLI